MYPLTLDIALTQTEIRPYYFEISAAISMMSSRSHYLFTDLIK